MYWPGNHGTWHRRQMKIHWCGTVKSSNEFPNYQCHCAQYIYMRLHNKQDSPISVLHHTYSVLLSTIAPATCSIMRATQVTSPDRKTSDKPFYLMDSERRFQKACQQIVQLQQKMGDLQFRYHKAWRQNHRSFRYSLRLQIAVVEGLINMYYNYAHSKAYTIADLRRQLFGEHVQIITSDTSDSE